MFCGFGVVERVELDAARDDLEVIGGEAEPGQLDGEVSHRRDFTRRGAADQVDVTEPRLQRRRERGEIVFARTVERCQPDVGLRQGVEQLLRGAIDIVAPGHTGPHGELRSYWL